ncbi:hypothetical protein NKR23_g7712 [Pleurostoma richardsiae]|uniref:BZIP transcription factor n=1 Tax=Pleurostoma richardsiae TaxID=41990 RepID=A0AA38RSQ8_9PEZI|nr:hypothetical protein NKR23_g7712 [Pleurostoma richardsiae]
MAQSPSAEPVKSGKRKGTRSVSTLTPAQLARKRANDREAQRAIRARTKEHIEKLEREIEDLRSQQNRDEAIQELIRRNKELEKQLRTLRESMGIPHTPQYPPAESLSVPNSTVSSRASSFGQHSAPADYKPQRQEFAGQYLSTPEPSENWSASIPVSVPPSTVSSPSSTGPVEEYNGYIPTSVPPPQMMEAVGMPPAPVHYPQEVEYEEVDRDHGFRRTNPVPMPQAYLQQQSWNLYPVYYPQSPAM